MHTEAESPLVPAELQAANASINDETVFFFSGKPLTDGGWWLGYSIPGDVVG